MSTTPSHDPSTRTSRPSPAAGQTRILVVGAGAIGGYFGGRLLARGRDVTFLVRPKRAQLLRKHGLAIRSALGDLDLPTPPLVQREALGEPFDLVVLSCKAYDLDDAIDAIAPAVGERTLVLPMLNGMRHLERLAERFGAARVIGGLCVIGSTLEENGTVRHLNRSHSFVFGALDPAQADAVAALEPVLSDAGFDARCSDRIRHEMWEKWVMLATMAASTTLMRAPLGDIHATADGRSFLEGLLSECRSIAAANGFDPRNEMIAGVKTMVSEPGSLLTASMYRDMLRDGPIEADHVIGDLIDRGATLDLPRLRLANVALNAYALQRARRLNTASAPAHRDPAS